MYLLLYRIYMISQFIACIRKGRFYCCLPGAYQNHWIYLKIAPIYVSMYICTGMCTHCVFINVRYTDSVQYNIVQYLKRLSERHRHLSCVLCCGCISTLHIQ